MVDLQWLWQRLAEYDERPCLIGEAIEFTYANLSDAIALRAEQIETSTPVGAVVALASDFSPEGIPALLALAKTGRVAVPIVTRNADALTVRLKEGSVTHFWQLRDGEDTIRALEAPPNAHDLLSALRQAGDPGLILFSSGSSGKPKAMLHNFGELLNSYERRRARSLKILAFLLFDHIGGLHTLLGALASGASLVLPTTREPEEIAHAIEEHNVAVLPASPTFLSLLLMSGAAERHDLTSLRIVSYGTEPMPESLLERLRATIPKARFIQTFGTSETGIAQTVSQSSRSLALRIDDPGTEYKIVDGELWLRSQTQIKGYLNADQDRFTQDGWFRTGDLVDELEDGYLRIRGRVSDIINVGGEKVFPAEVESVLLELPDVADCFAFAQPSPLTGQAVAIEVVAIPTADTATLKREIRRHCLARLERYKMPARITFVKRTTVGERFKRLRQLSNKA